jgi:hypothetical protein
VAGGDQLRDQPLAHRTAASCQEHLHREPPRRVLSRPKTKTAGCV